MDRVAIAGANRLSCVITIIVTQPFEGRIEVREGGGCGGGECVKLLQWN